jgi:cysteinyl-tRNA synthetase
MNSISLYDSYQKRLVQILPDQTVAKTSLKIYSCGPTVYNYMHIGNLRATWLPDTITKIAKIAGYQTEWVQNITDVGHLVSDGDDGEDKMEKGVKRENKTVAEIVEFYTNDFKKQCGVLNFNLPKGKFQPRPTEYIKEQMLLALELVRDKKAYILDDGIYFDSEANKAVEVEVNLIKPTNYTGRDIVNTTKNPEDFALWKFVEENALQKWRFNQFDEIAEILKEISNGLQDSPSVKGNLRTQGSIGLNNVDDNNRIYNLPNRWGCPGWHSECVAMICSILGRDRFLKNDSFDYANGLGQDSAVIDIHTGGEDHIDIHHKNERLQSKALGFELATYWVHNKFVMVDNKKMAKSDGNVFMATGNYEQTGFYSLTNPPVEIVNHLEKKYQITGFDPLAFRLMFLEHHYSEQLNFTWEKMEQSQNRLWNLRKEMAKIQSFAKLNNISETLETKQIQVLLEPLLDNLDIPKFLEKFQAFLLDTTTEIQKNNNLNPKNLAALNYWESQFLQLNLNPNIPTEILELGQQRLAAKADKDYPKSDQIRNEILASGYQIDDYSWGYGFWFRG